MTSANAKRTADRPAGLARRMAESLIPGDEAFSGPELQEAAHFVQEAARNRKPGETAMALESATHARRYTRIAIINDDMPFLVDSVAATIAAQGVMIDRLVHPVVSKSGGTSESVIYIETPRIDARQRRALASALSATLADVRAAVQDWPELQTAMERDAALLGDTEGAALLRWLNGGMLTQLGHVTIRRDGSRSDRLGICRRSTCDLLSPATCERAFAWFEDTAERARKDCGGAPLAIKANQLARVHRRVPLDLFIVPVREAGDVTALSIHAGIWTSAALAASPTAIPRLRARLTAIMDRRELSPVGHDGKALLHALTALPHDLLTGFSQADVERVAAAMMNLADRPRPRLALVAAPLQRHLFAFIWLPRDMVSTMVRQQVQAMLVDASGGEVLDWSLQVEGGTLAMLRFVIDIRESAAAPDEAALDQQLQAMLRGWPEAVEAELAALGEDPSRAAAMAGRYAEAFPIGYRTQYGAAEGARDIRRLRALAARADGGWTRDARLYHLASDEPGRLRLKIYQHGGALPLSDAVPALENFGFRVLLEIPTTLDEGRIGTIHDFTLELPEGEDARALLNRAEVIEGAIAGVLNGQATDDAFNRLVIDAALAAREANWLRALYRYLRQTGANFTIQTVVQALARAPQVVRGLIDLFVALHDPGHAGDRESAADRARNAIGAGLAGVGAINDDRLLRTYRSVIEATLRTNAFAPAAAEALAFKLDSAGVPKLPSPVPWREIFVYSRRVEGIHLRAGPIARGGIRWSDRRDDFRTEVLGLMKAQRVKNAVIVPTGAKGGFCPKHLPDPARDRDGWAAEGQASYEVFIRTLLSVTDNIVDGKVVHPAGVVVRDGDDPYFVVAADKGTAKFSDIANAIAEARDFWLDDAFASGGSHGYDHKAMGITARGAWLSVRRHFSELGVDVQNDPVRVVGCGDMSGDVFGNGMLLSKSIRLVAAFDHRHIFIDPDPDPVASWKERKRLFALSRSSWADYDSTLISKGGGIFARSKKRIALSAAARRMLGIEAKEIEPDALIAALLRAPVDLLWFGGIGTYVKSAGETHGAVGDPANDALRVDGRDIRAKVIGEGANLGVTQAGRIEYALTGAGGSGGRINTDFIDNSAGVDCSDNEVNIKIALAAARRAGRLSEERRNALLAEMTDDVAALVLEDNRLQAMALSIAERGGARAVPSQMRLIDVLEERGLLDRRTEGIADGDMLARRAGEGRGLTRPELAVLLSSAKLAIQGDLERSTVPDDPGLEDILLASFPAAMQEQFRQQLLGHRLRREIIATELANMVINRLGIVHPFELAEEEGASLAHVCAAFVSASRLFGLGPIQGRLDKAAMDEDARLLLFERLALATRGHMADLLRAGAGTIPSLDLETRLKPGIDALLAGVDRLLRDEARQQSLRQMAELRAAGAPARDANMIADLFEMDGSIGLARLAAESGVPAAALAAAFTALGEIIRLDWAQGTAAGMEPSDPWERVLVAGLARDFQQMRIDFLGRAVRPGKSPDSLDRALESWIGRHDSSIAQFRAMVARAQSAPVVTPAMLAQIAGQARNLLAR